MNDFMLLVGRHFTVLPTLADQQGSELQLDSLGRLIISGRWLEDTQHISGDAGLFALGVRDDGVAATGTVTVVDYTLLAGATLTVAGTALVEGVDWTAAVSNNATATSLASAINALALVNAAAIGAVITITAATPGSAGNSLALVTTDAVNLTISGATLSGGADNTVQTSDNGDYSPIAVDKYGRIYTVTELDVDFDYVYDEDSVHVSGDKGAYVLAVRQDVLASSTSANGDYASFKVNAAGELYVVDTAANASLDNIELYLSNLQQEEDDVHVSGDKGIMSLAVSHAAETSMVSADGDYAPLQVNAVGRLKVDAIAQITLPGSEEYTVTDALAAGGDGLVTITASATPWVTVASFAHTSGTAYIYGLQWACDQNADARLVTDDTTDIIVYKRMLNSSAMPTWAEHWSEGRIEIAGAASLEIKLQVKKRSATGGNALGTGSIHIRK